MFKRYTFTDMWRLFDKGLHLFLKNHVYLPVIRKSETLLSRLLGSFSAFFVVFLWQRALVGQQDTKFALNIIRYPFISFGWYLSSRRCSFYWNISQSLESPWDCKKCAWRVQAFYNKQRKKFKNEVFKSSFKIFGLSYF